MDVNTVLYLEAFLMPLTSSAGSAPALAHDAKVYGTARMWLDQPADDNHVMIGFSAIALEDIAPGVAALKSAWLDR